MKNLVIIVVSQVVGRVELVKSFEMPKCFVHVSREVNDYKRNKNKEHFPLIN